MKTEKETPECCSEKFKFVKNHCHHHGNNNHPIYGLGIIGALFYFLQGATTFTAVIIGIAKSIFWPAVLMFYILNYLHL